MTAWIAHRQVLALAGTPALAWIAGPRAGCGPRPGRPKGRSARWRSRRIAMPTCCATARWPTTVAWRPGSTAASAMWTVRYTGRTPHIHVKVRLGERELLTTQLYVAGEAGNAGDPLWGALRDPADVCRSSCWPPLARRAARPTQPCCLVSCPSRSRTECRNDSFSANCRYTCVSSLSRSRRTPRSRA